MNYVRNITRGAVSLVAALALAASAHAITFNLFEGNGINSGGADNTVTFTSGGVTVTVTGWTQATVGGVFTQSNVERWDGGLGVMNDTEGGASPAHKVDNVGSFDYLLFAFDSLVDINLAELRSVTTDSDLGLYIGTGLSTATLLQTSGYFESNSGNGSDRIAVLNAGNVVGNYLLIGALPGTEQNDYFKVYSIDVTKHVPDSSATFGMLSLVLVGLGLAKRRLRR